MLPPEATLAIAVGQVGLWKILMPKIKQRRPTTELYFKALEELTWLMLPIYALPAVFHQFGVSIFFVLIPYVGLITFWYVRWYHMVCSDAVEKKLLQATVRKMFSQLLLFGFSSC